MNLLDQLRDSRKFTISVGQFVFTLLRPTDAEATEMRYTTLKDGLEGISKFVVGWEGVALDDIVSGGGAEPAPFSSDLFLEWAYDRPEIWDPLVDGVLSAYSEYREGRREAEKR